MSGVRTRPLRSLASVVGACLRNDSRGKRGIKATSATNSMEASATPVRVSTRKDFQADAMDLLVQLTIAESACCVVSPGRETTVNKLRVKCVGQQTSVASWTALLPDSMFACSLVEFSAPLTVTTVLVALYHIEQRLKWDRSSFTAYETLCKGTLQHSTGAFEDAIYCKMSMPSGLRHRDMAQERFLFRLPDGGFGIVMRSLSPERAAALGKPPQGDAVRATTHLSGFLLRPRIQGGVALFALSQTDVGTGIPQWVQGVAKHTAFSRLKQWAGRLENHCRSQISTAVPASVARAIASLPASRVSASGVPCRTPSLTV